MAKIIQLDDPDVMIFTSFGKIYIGPRYLALPDIEQRALMLHEVGHLHHHHQLKRFLSLIPALWKGKEWLYGVCRKQELEADRYSVEHGGAFGMLQYFARHDMPATEFYPSTHERVLHILRILCDGSAVWEG